MPLTGSSWVPGSRSHSVQLRCQIYSLLYAVPLNFMARLKFADRQTDWGCLSVFKDMAEKLHHILHKGITIPTTCSL